MRRFDDEGLFRLFRLGRRCCRYQRLGESVVPRMEFLNVSLYAIVDALDIDMGQLLPRDRDNDYLHYRHDVPSHD